MRTENAVWWAATASSILVILGSIGGRTQRIYGRMGEDGYTVATESGTRWAVWAFVWGLAALITLAAGRAWRRRHGRLAVGSAASTVVLLSLVVERAGRHWIGLLEERGQTRTYELDVALGLPISVTAAALGAGYALVLAGIWLRQNDAAGDTLRRPLVSSPDRSIGRSSSAAR